MNYENEKVHLARVEQMRAVIRQTYDDLVACHLADLLGEPFDHLNDRVYRRLESMPSRDLALALVVVYADLAQARAQQILRALEYATSPEDAR